MNKQFILDQYRKARKHGRSGDCMLLYGALDAWRHAKWEARKRDCPFQHDGDTLETEDGFTIVYRVEYDDLGRDDLLGDSYGEITDGTPDRNGIDGVNLGEDRRSRNRTYFPNPCWKFKDRLAQYRKAGMAKHAAYLAAMAGLRKEAETYQGFVDDGINSVWQQCKVYRTSDYDENGEDAEEFGEDSLGGTEEDSAIDSLVDYDLPGNALDHAREIWAKRLEAEACQQMAARPDMYQEQVRP